MAHFDEPFRPDWRKPETPEQCSAWEHVARVFGRPPSSIRPVSELDGQTDAWFVRLECHFNESFEFICAGGLLVGIPPKGSRDKSDK